MEATDKTKDRPPELTKEGRRYRRRVAVYVDEETLGSLTRWIKQEGLAGIDGPTSAAFNYALNVFLGRSGYPEVTGYGAAWKKVQRAAAPIRKREAEPPRPRRLNPMGLHVVKADEEINPPRESTPQHAPGGI